MAAGLSPTKSTIHYTVNIYYVTRFIDNRVDRKESSPKNVLYKLFHLYKNVNFLLLCIINLGLGYFLHHWSKVTHARESFCSLVPPLLVLVLKSNTFCSRFPPTTASIDVMPPRTSHCTCAWLCWCCWLAARVCCCCACGGSCSCAVEFWPAMVGTFGPGLADWRREDNTSRADVITWHTLRACAVCWECKEMERQKGTEQSMEKNNDSDAHAWCMMHMRDAWCTCVMHDAHAWCMMHMRDAHAWYNNGVHPRAGFDNVMVSALFMLLFWYRVFFPFFFPCYLLYKQDALWSLDIE